MRAWLLKYYTGYDYVIIPEYGNSLSAYKHELYEIKNNLNLNILNIENNEIGIHGEFEFIDSWKFNDKNIEYLCSQFNTKAAMLGMKVECSVNSSIGGCVMTIQGDTYIPEKIPDWVNIILNHSANYKVLNKQVKLGKTTYILGQNVFNNSNLEQIEFNSRLAIISKSALDNCRNLDELRLPKHLLYIATKAVRYGVYLKTLSLYKPIPDIYEFDGLRGVIPIIGSDIIEFRTPNLSELNINHHNKITYRHLVFNEKLKNVPIETLLIYINAYNTPEISFKSFHDEE